MRTRRCCCCCFGWVADNDGLVVVVVGWMGTGDDSGPPESSSTNEGRPTSHGDRDDDEEWAIMFAVTLVSNLAAVCTLSVSFRISFSTFFCCSWIFGLLTFSHSATCMSVTSIRANSSSTSNLSHFSYSQDFMRWEFL